MMIHLHLQVPCNKMYYYRCYIYTFYVQLQSTTKVDITFYTAEGTQYECDNASAATISMQSGQHFYTRDFVYTIICFLVEN